MNILSKFKVSKNTAIGQIISALEPTIAERIEGIRKFELSKGRTYSEFSKECDTLHLVFDLVKSVGTYTEPTDKVVEFTAGTGRKGNFEINATIERNGQQHYFNTESILAGGYNIQRLHVRYITQTSLPKQKSTSLLVALSDAIKGNKKIASLELDIIRYEKYLKGVIEKLNERKGIRTNQQKLDFNNSKVDYNILSTWNDLNDSAKEYYQTKELYNVERKETLNKQIKSFDMWNKSYKNDVIKFKENIKKLKLKIKEIK